MYICCSMFPKLCGSSKHICIYTLHSLPPGHNFELIVAGTAALVARRNTCRRGGTRTQMRVFVRQCNTLDLRTPHCRRPSLGNNTHIRSEPQKPANIVSCPAPPTEAKTTSVKGNQRKQVHRKQFVEIRPLSFLNIQSPPIFPSI